MEYHHRDPATATHTMLAAEALVSLTSIPGSSPNVPDISASDDKPIEDSANVMEQDAAMMALPAPTCILPKQSIGKPDRDEQIQMSSHLT